MIRIGALIPNKKDATSLYRGMGPLAHIMRNYNVTVRQIDGAVSWVDLTEFDLVFLQRPAKPEALSLLKMAQRVGVPVWVDFDDYVFDVPTDNPAWTFYANPETRKTIQAIMKSANVLTVSTGKLKELYNNLNPNTVVIPNAIDRHYICNIPEFPRKKTLLWRGTDTHVKDVTFYKDEILKALEAHPDWNVTFLGWFPWFLADKLGSRLTFHATSNPLEFFNVFNKEQPAITMVPLFDSDFNQSKSCIAALEATVCGSAVLAPMWDEWRIPGVSHYTSKEMFFESLDQMMTEVDRSLDALEHDNKAALEYLENNKTLDQTNIMRMKIIRELSRVPESVSLERFPSERKRYAYPIRCTSTHKSS